MLLYQWSRRCHTDLTGLSHRLSGAEGFPLHDARTQLKPPKAKAGQGVGGISHCGSICHIQFSPESLHWFRNGNNQGFLEAELQYVLWCSRYRSYSKLSAVTWEGGLLCVSSTGSKVSVGGGRGQLGRSNMSSVMTYPVTDVMKKNLISVLLSVNSLIRKLISNLRLRSRKGDGDVLIQSWHLSLGCVCLGGGGELCKGLTKDFHSSTSRGPTTVSIHHSGQRRIVFSGSYGGKCKPDESNKLGQQWTHQGESFYVMWADVCSDNTWSHMTQLIDHRRAIYLT